MNKNISIDELFKENRIVVPEPNPIVANKIYQKYQNNNQRKKSQTIFFKRTLLPIGSLTIFIVFVIVGISFIFHPSYKDDKMNGFNYDKSPIEANPGSTPDESSLTNNIIYQNSIITIDLNKKIDSYDLTYTIKNNNYSKISLEIDKKIIDYQVLSPNNTINNIDSVNNIIMVELTSDENIIIMVSLEKGDEKYFNSNMQVMLDDNKYTINITNK